MIKVGQIGKLPLAAKLGFQSGKSSVHTSRTMMLAELSLILENVGPQTRADEYVAAVVEQNVLGKPTQTTRKRTAQRLAQLYALDQSCPIFRLLRHFWSSDVAAQPLLAYLAATARDIASNERTKSIGQKYC